MPFGPPHDRYFNNIFAPAVVEAGLEPVRADSLFRSTPIVGDIWRLTREATVLLADLTGKNANVFYELGLAHAIGKPVILVSSSIDDVPFDLRALRVLIYDKDDESWGANLQGNIVRALAETLEDLASAVPTPFLDQRQVERPSEDPTTLEFRRLWNEIRSLRSSQSQTSYSAPRNYELPPPVNDPTALRIVREQLGGRIPELTDQALGTILTYLVVGQTIQAIKFFREVTGWQLKQSKDAIDAIRDIAPRLNMVLMG